MHYIIALRTGIKFIGMPSFIAAGTHTKGEQLKNGKTKDATRYRFLVMPRFGSDLQKVLDSNNLKLPLKTAYTIGIKILDILEYMHSYGYIHADIKASNLLLSMKAKPDNRHDEIWLVDFGLVEKYLQGDNSTHKPYEEDLRRANNGTIEFTSRDAHIGCFSRKGDIEILAYNLLSWLSGGRLPWMSNLADKTLVKNLKNNYMNRLDDLLNYAFQTTRSETVTSANKKAKTSNTNKSAIPDGMADFFKQVIKMKYHDKPDYKLLSSILEKAIISNGEKCDGSFYLSESDRKKSASQSKKPSPLKRKHASSKKSINESIDNCSEVSVIFDEETEDEEEIVQLPVKKRKASSNGVSSTAGSRRSPTVLNAKIASNGRTKNNHMNGKSSSVQKSNGQLLNENGINKLNNELVIVNSDPMNDEDELDTKRRRRNPSRKVKHSQTALNENLKLVNEPAVKNGHIKNSTTVYNKSENQIVIQGKIYTNPTPAMLELYDRVNGKSK